MELFEQIRREYEHGVGTIKGVARKFKVHRRMVREALGSATPRERKKAEREKPKLAAVIGWIDGVLEADQKAPRKQRHTSRRIWTRLKQERPEVEVAESTVREYGRKRKIEMGLGHGEVFVPQSYRWGQEGQVDWYEAWAENRRRAAEGVRVLPAEHGERRGVSPGVSACQSTGVFGSA